MHDVLILKLRVDVGESCDGCNPGARYNVASSWKNETHCWLHGGLLKNQTGTLVTSLLCLLIAPIGEYVLEDTWMFELATTKWYYMGGPKTLQAQDVSV